jgi:hypothetical protein
LEKINFENNNIKKFKLLDSFEKKENIDFDEYIKNRKNFKDESTKSNLKEIQNKKIEKLKVKIYYTN